MVSWIPTPEHVTIKVKRAPWLVGIHRMAGGFLYAPRGRENLTRQARIKHPREKLSSWAQQVGI